MQNRFSPLLTVGVASRFVVDQPRFRTAVEQRLLGPEQHAGRDAVEVRLHVLGRPRIQVGVGARAVRLDKENGHAGDAGHGVAVAENGRRRRDNLSRRLGARDVDARAAQVLEVRFLFEGRCFEDVTVRGVAAFRLTRLLHELPLLGFDGAAHGAVVEAHHRHLLVVANRQRGGGDFLTVDAGDARLGF